VLARPAKTGEEITTVTGDGEETHNTAKEGDFVIRNLTQAEEEYIISKDTFQEKYQFIESAEDPFDRYKAIGTIQAIELTEEVLEQAGLQAPFYFEAPWKESIVAKAGDFLVMPSGKKEIYRIARKEFFETYTVKE